MLGCNEAGDCISGEIIRNIAYYYSEAKTRVHPRGKGRISININFYVRITLEFSFSIREGKERQAEHSIVCYTMLYYAMLC